MTNRRHCRCARAASAILLSLSIVACGEAPSTLAQGAGAASPTPTTGSGGQCLQTEEHSRFLVDFVAGYPLWIEAAGLLPIAPEPPDEDEGSENPASPEEERTRYRPVEPETLRGTAPPATLTAPTGLVEEASPQAERLVVGVSHDDFGALFARLTAAGPDFFGNCASERAGREFARFATERQLDGESANEAFLRLIASPEGPEAAALRAAVLPAPRVPWSDLPPMERFLDVEARPAPPESVQQRIERVPTEILLPSEWATYPYSICTRVDEGWGECSAMSAADQTSAGAHLPLVTYATERGPTELWILPEDGALEGRLGRVLILPPGFERARGLRLRGQGKFSGPDEFAAAARRGASLLVAAR
jgi:hypothetical protein